MNTKHAVSPVVTLQGTGHDENPEPIRKTNRSVNLALVTAFQFDPLVHRMVDKYKWNEAESRECFEDLKKFLYMAVIADKPVAPTEKLDEMWHNFILYTMDYDEF